ncbi:MAG TPA: SRPBCC family protein, partial [Gaiellaceae bacterium]|nr:SRPBCC family protein [Gaiellaceae bacterium]
MHEIDVQARSAAPAEQVWRLLADARTWAAWGAFDEAEVEEGRGLGELRRFRTGRVVSRERVTGFDPARRLRYEVVSGLPIRDYRAEVTLAPTAEGGTQIRWRSTFAAKIPGTGRAIQRKLAQLAAETADALAQAAET